MKRFPFKRHLIILGACILLIGVMVPLATFAKSSSGEKHSPSRPPQVKNSVTGKLDPTVTIMQGCPATAPINPTPFNAGDVVSGTATFTATDTGEANESEEANNALAVFITIPPVFVKLNQTTSFTFIATAGDQLKACFVTYDGDEVGTINYTVTSPSSILHLKLNLTERHEPASAELKEQGKLNPQVFTILNVVDCATEILTLGEGHVFHIAGVAYKVLDITNSVVGVTSTTFAELQDLQTNNIVVRELTIVGEFAKAVIPFESCYELFVDYFFEPLPPQATNPPIIPVPVPTPTPPR